MSLVYANATGRTVVMVRLIVFGMAFFEVATQSFVELSELPIGLVKPINPIVYYPGLAEWLLKAEVLRGLQLSLLLFTGLAALGVSLPWTSAVAFALMVLREALPRAFGHDNHAQISLIMAMFALSLASWADRICDRHHGWKSSHINRHTYPPLLVALALTLTYCFMGVRRLIAGGVDIYTSGSITYWMGRQGHADSLHGLGLGRYVGDYQLIEWAIVIGFPIITAIELLAPICLVSFRFRLLFLVSMFIFHIMTYLFMNILFAENMILLLLLIDRDTLPRLRMRATSRPTEVSG